MAFTAPTFQDWKSFFPDPVFPDFTETVYNSMMVTAELYVPPCSPYPNENFFKQIFIYCMGHLAFEYENLIKNDLTSNAGPIVSASAAPVHVSYRNSGITNDFMNYWGQSAPGRIFINLIQKLIKEDSGNRLVGIGVV